MVYEIWDLDSGNRLGEYDTRDEALTEVKHALEAHGERYAATLLLDVEDDQGRTHLIAKGAQLVALARGGNGHGMAGGAGPTPVKPTMTAVDKPVPSRRGVSNRPQAPYSSRDVDGYQRVAARSAATPGRGGGSRYVRRDARGRFTSDQIEIKHKDPKGQKDRSK